jgi:hypothetical protein
VVFVVMSSKYRIGNASSGNDGIDDKSFSNGLNYTLSLGCSSINGIKTMEQ